MAEEKKIPYQKAVRVGNYKLWRSKTAITINPTEEERSKVRVESHGRKKLVSKRFDIDVINVSNLDGSWKVQLPATMMIYTIICDAFNQPEEVRDNFLRLLFGNYLTLTTSSSLFLHDAMCFISELLAFPYMLLSEKDMSARMLDFYKEKGIDKKEAKDQIEKFVIKRRELYKMIDKKVTNIIDDYEIHLNEEITKEKEKEAQKQLEDDELAEQSAEVIGKEKK